MVANDPGMLRQACLASWKKEVANQPLSQEKEPDEVAVPVNSLPDKAPNTGTLHMRHNRFTHNQIFRVSGRFSTPSPRWH